MKKQFYIDLISKTLLMFTLFDISYAIVDYEELMELESPLLRLLKDLFLCFINSFFSLLLCDKILTFYLNRHRVGIHKFWKIKLIIFIPDIIIAFSCGALLGCFGPISYPLYYFNNAFMFCGIASISTMCTVLQAYYQVMLDKNNEKIRLEKNCLKQQLDPHFIFNSLSVLSGMIYLDSQKAEKYIVKLARVYRHILTNLNKDIITVSEGINLIIEYTELLNVRFFNNIILKIDEKDFKDSDYILTWSLRLLIENAVKHNLPDGKDKLHIKIYKEESFIIVSNTISNNDCKIESFGIGLKNLSNRYLLECNKKPEISIDDNLFKVKIPIITRP